MTGASQAALNAAPAKRVYQMAVMRARTDQNTQPKNPTDISFEIPESYRRYTTANGHVEQFLLYDSGVNDPARLVGGSDLSRNSCALECSSLAASKSLIICIW